VLFKYDETLLLGGDPDPFQVPEGAEVVFSGGTTSVDLPLEAGRYYISTSNFGVNVWISLDVNPALWDELNYQQANTGYGRQVAGGAGLISHLSARCTKINDTTMRFNATVFQVQNALSIFVISNRTINRILRAK
jgi:hypothetical protein